MSIWTDTQKEKLQRLWNAGSTTAFIAEALGSSFTRNSVIGMAHRMGLAGRPNPIKGEAKPKKPRIRKPSQTAIHQKRRADRAIEEHGAIHQRRGEQVAARAERVQLSEAEALTIRELEEKRARRLLGRAIASGRHECVYPIGDPKAPDFRFCGALVQPHSCYCETHHRACRKPIEQIQAAA